MLLEPASKTGDQRRFGFADLLRRVRPANANLDQIVAVSLGAKIRVVVAFSPVRQRAAAFAEMSKESRRCRPVSIAQGSALPLQKMTEVRSGAQIANC